MLPWMPLLSLLLMQNLGKVKLLPLKRENYAIAWIVAADEKTLDYGYGYGHVEEKGLETKIGQNTKLQGRESAA